MGAAHPNAMQPPKPGRTRTAPPEMPSSWWSAPRIRNYLLFDATGIVYFLVAFFSIELIWALGDGPERWADRLATLSNPLYLGFHVIALASVIFVAVRFFSLFPKAQPRDTGLPMPPAPVIKAMLYVIWIGLTVLMVAVLAGGIF
ncbi:MAG: hypothetical protein QF570_20460 [Myxococcota bacterium]|jgi:fumarate reductase subunit C|nr:hypothetical protein [Myxococcota bacterium]